MIIMNPYHAIAILITLTALFAYINHRLIKMPMSIGLMLMSLLVALGTILADKLGLPAAHYADQLIASIDFNEVLMKGMLGVLLFAGALHINLNDLAEQKLEISIFATFGVILSTFLVSTAVYALGAVLDLNIRFIEALLFGALISPTDPIAVLGILKKAGAPKSLEIKIAGESLFNDGIGVVLFLVIMEVAAGGSHTTPLHVAKLFGVEVIGGVIFGLFSGYAAYRLIKSVNNYQVEILLTLALVIGGYTLAAALHLSAPIAMVVAGLLIGNQGRRLAMSATTREHLDMFWELVDEILNALLFVLIGLEVLVLTFHGKHLIAAGIAIPTVLLARFISIGIPITVLRKWRSYAPRAIRVMTWGGLRGGISVALALSLPPDCNRNLLLTMTYIVVAFSVLVQGLTIKKMVKQNGMPDE